MEIINVEQRALPDDYHCDCTFCRRFRGLLIRKDGTKYSKTERRKYYSPKESKHIAKTPLHLARWAIQTYSKENDWVLDPTMGAGTTAVEALRLGRNTAGIELQFYDVIVENVLINNPFKKKHVIRAGDARNLNKYFRRKFDLVVNNPPYSGDENQKGFGGKSAKYDKNIKENLAHLKEREDYWLTIEDIYTQCHYLMKPGAHFILGVKDMIKNKKPYCLHCYFGDILGKLFIFKGMFLLPHHPPTLFMNTYNKRFPNVKVPRYQTILVFKKE